MFCTKNPEFLLSWFGWSGQVDRRWAANFICQMFLTQLFLLLLFHYSFFLNRQRRQVQASAHSPVSSDAERWRLSHRKRLLQESCPQVQASDVSRRRHPTAVLQVWGQGHGSLALSACDLEKVVEAGRGESNGDVRMMSALCTSGDMASDISRDDRAVDSAQMHDYSWFFFNSITAFRKDK